MYLSFDFSFWVLTGHETDVLQEVYVCILPFFHMYGMVGVMLTGLDLGAKMVILPRFEGDSYVNSLHQHHVNRYCTICFSFQLAVKLICYNAFFLAVDVTSCSPFGFISWTSP